MKPLTVCITYDDNFEPMCSQLCSNLRVDGIRIRLNKTDSREDYRSGFQSSNWYSNLSQKMLFLRSKMEEVDEGEVICVADADIQFFRPDDLLRVKSSMEASDIEYAGQRGKGRTPEHTEVVPIKLGGYFGRVGGEQNLEKSCIYN